MPSFISNGTINSYKLWTFTVFSIICVDVAQQTRASVINSNESLTTGEFTRNFRSLRNSLFLSINFSFYLASHEKDFIFNSFLIYFITICVAHYTLHRSLGQGIRDLSQFFTIFTNRLSNFFTSITRIVVSVFFSGFFREFSLNTIPYVQIQT